MSFGRTLKTEHNKVIDIQVCIFGDTASGKSQIISSFCKGKDSDYKNQVVELVNQNEIFYIQECSDQQKMTMICNKSTNIIITCDLVKVIQNNTLESKKISDYLSEFMKISSHIILVGTKSDLVQSNTINMQNEDKFISFSKNQRGSLLVNDQNQIKQFQEEPKRNPNQKRSSSLLIQSKEQIQQHPSQILKKIANNYRVQYIETSSKDSNSINLIFQLLLGNIQQDLFMKEYKLGMQNQTQINQNTTTTKQNPLENKNISSIHLNSNSDDKEDGTIYYSSCF
ncbi:hypothetical protein ABPG74_000725 [Tetrahymena malaccensis]